MSRSSNSLKTSDVVTTPIKLKYASSYDSGSIGEYGIRVYAGVNEPFGPEIGYSQEAMVYQSVKHLYYSNYISGSFPASSSYYDNWLQSTSALGTVEADQRYFPTASYDTVQVISFPKSVFGEKISRYSFRVQANTYLLGDDGNGNVWDIANAPDYILAAYFEDPDEYFEIIQEYATKVGNILYAQGLVIITNQDYKNIFGNLEYLLQEDATYLLQEDLSKIKI
jgi:hypothetical protein